MEKPLGIATLYHPTQIQNHDKVEQFEKDSCMFHKNDKLTLITYNYTMNFSPEY